MSCVEVIYWLIAIAFSIYYGYRGLLIEKDTVKQVNATRHNNLLRLKSEIKKNDKDLLQSVELKEYAPFNQEVWTHYIQGSILYFVSGMVGFIALYVLYSIYITTNHFSDINTGTGAAVIFLSLLSIIGISGELPYVIKFGNIFSSK